jgi:hypothetical protein
VITPPLDTEAQARELALSVYAITDDGQDGRSRRRAAVRTLTRDACDYARITPGAYEARFLDGLTGWEPENSAVVANLIRQAFEAGRAGRDEAVKLLERVLRLRQNGERAPGGDETWPPLDRDVEAWLRRVHGMLET